MVSLHPSSPLGHLASEEERERYRQHGVEIVNGIANTDLAVITISRPMIVGNALRLEVVDVSAKQPILVLAGRSIRFDPPAKRCRILWEPHSFCTLVADDDPLPILRQIADVLGHFDEMLLAQETPIPFEWQRRTRLVKLRDELAALVGEAEFSARSGK